MFPLNTINQIFHSNKSNVKSKRFLHRFLEKRKRKIKEEKEFRRLDLNGVSFSLDP